MKTALHLLYIPGLGDSRVSGQQKLVNTWRHWGVSAELFQMNWADGEDWEPKFNRLLERIDANLESGKAVGLVGASAGASAAINAFAARQDKVQGAVLIAGKVNRPAAIGSDYRRKNPAFLTSAQDCAAALAKLDTKARQRILSRYALIDEVVHKADSRIPGVHNQIVPTVGHAPTIALQLLFGAPSFIRFLKRLG